jgi:hypothetical protein
MTTEAEGQWEYWWANGWPGGLGTILMMSGGMLLKRWMPLHFALGIAGLVGWFGVGLIYVRRSPPQYGMPRWVAATATGLAGGLSVGLLSYFFPF